MKIIKLKALTYGQLAAFLCMLLIIMMPSAATEGAKRGLWLCGEMIIPSTFAFMALVTFVSRAGKGIRLGRSQIIPTFLIGMLSGYPVGARYVTELKNDGRLTEKEAQRCLAFCVGAGPAFVITAVGKGMFGSFSVGIIIFFSQLLACACFGIATCMFAGKERCEKTPSRNDAVDVADCFVSSVKDSCFAILSVCAFVILFSSVLNIAASGGILDAMAAALTGIGLKRSVAFVLVGGFLEVTNGCAMCDGASLGMIAAASAVVGFGGLSVFFQIAAVTSGSGLKMGRFFLSRIIIAVISSVITAILVRIFPLSVETVSLQSISAGYSLHSMPVCIVLTVFAAALIISDKRKGEISLNA